MCGISGFFSPKQKFTKEHLLKMTQRLGHRGPDAEGIFQDDVCALGQRRLSVIDLSEDANQPMISQNKRYILCFNGEIYNFQEIANTLDVNLKTSSDTEVLLELYVQRGLEALQELNGMFAIALYDKLEQSLYLFRDRIGIKPLYYTYDGENLAFASETKALLELPIDKTLNLEALKDYFFLEYIPGDQSIFKSIHKLSQGYYLKVDRQGFEIKQYYNIYEKIDFEGKDKGEQHYKEGFVEKLEKSIQYRSISDVPIGAFLSGGTDSSLICSIFQKQNQQPINTFTIGFDVASFDESVYAEQVSTHLNTKHQLDRINAEDSLAKVNQIVKHYDEPFAVPSTIPSLLVSEKARGKVTVAMSGDGGDELFMGYGYYFWYDRIKKVSNVGGYAARKLVSSLFAGLDNRKQRAGRVFDYKDFSKIWLHIWSQEQYMFSEKEISQLFNEKYEHETTWKEWQKIDKLPLHTFEKISLFDINNYLANNLLHKIDIASMANSLEVRVPFLDHNLVEYALNIPHQYKIQGKEQKYLMKKTLIDYLPKELVYRKKWGFPAPVGVWLKKELAFLIDKYLSENRVQKQGIFNYKPIQKMILEFKHGKDYHYKRIWALLTFQMWYDEYLGD